MRTFKFVKEGKLWYVDLPEYPGDRADLQMVAGADTLLDRYSQGKSIVTMNVSKDAFVGSDALLKLADLSAGADYVIEALKGEPIDLSVWLCDVMLFVYGYFPEILYIKQIDNE